MKLFLIKIKKRFHNIIIMIEIIQEVFILLKYKQTNLFNNSREYPPYTPLRENMIKKIDKFMKNNDESILLISSSGNGMNNYYLIKSNNKVYEVLITGLVNNNPDIAYIKEY